MSNRQERLVELEQAYEAVPVGEKSVPTGIEAIARALGRAKLAGVSDREAMDAMRSRQWSRYKIYKDAAREMGML